jgi:hypothetical protein
MEKFEISRIQDLIDTLELIKNKYGDLPIMKEYDASYSLGSTVFINDEHNPDDYLGKKIKVVMIQ